MEERVQELFNQFAKTMPAETAANLTLAMMFGKFLVEFKKATEKMEHLTDAIRDLKQSFPGAI